MKGMRDSKTLQDKMEEWIENGCQLAWMINPEKEKRGSIVKRRRKKQNPSP